MIDSRARSAFSGGAVLLVIAAVTAASRDSLSAAADDAAAPENKRIPVPIESEQQLAEKFLGKIIDVEPRDATAARQAAKRLLEKVEDIGSSEGEIIDEGAVRYVLLNKARELGENAGDAALALRAAEKIEEGYEVDGLDLKLRSLQRTLQAGRDPKERTAVARLALDISSQAVDADAYSKAKDLATLARAALRGLKDKALEGSAARLLKRISSLSRSYRRIRNSLEKLVENPEDEAANLAVGEFLCFLKGDWERGLRFLAKGDDFALSDIAKTELEGSTKVLDQVTLAERWIRVAKTAKKKHQEQVHLHARRILNAAASESGGLVRIRIDALLEEIPSYDLDLHITVLIDGHDSLLISLRELEWVHRRNAWPKDLRINGRPWDPRESGSFSLRQKRPRTSQLDFAAATVDKREGRGAVTHRVQQGKLVVRFDDPAPGAATYDVKIHVPLR